MTIGPVKFVLPPLETPLLKTGIEYNEGSNKSGGFSQVLGNAIGNLKDAHNQSDLAMEKFSSGEDIDVADVMLTIEKTQIATDLAIQVRNRLVDGFNQLIRMQV
jgi:flagellar hook-basal body complex protein FliE